MGLPVGFSAAPRSEMPSPDVIRQMAVEKGLDPDIISRQVRQESGGNPNAVSSKGAIGPMQLMPRTAAALGVDPHDPVQNLHGGMSYMQQLLTKYNGDYEKALAAYNAGPEAVDKHGGVPPYPETQNYVNSIMREGEVARHEGPTMSSGLPAGFTASLGEAPASVSPTQTPSAKGTLALAADLAGKEILGDPNFSERFKSVGPAASEWWDQANPLNWLRSLEQITNHPIATVNEDAQQREEIFDRAMDSFHRGDYGEGITRIINYGLPFLGPQIQRMADLQKSGQYAREAGALAGFATNVAVGKYGGSAFRLAARALQVPSELAEYAPRTPTEMATGEGEIRPASGAQGAINRSMGAQVRDVRYGDPSRALIDNSISTPTTSGRLQAVTSKIDELAPQLEQKLTQAAQDGEHRTINVVDTLSPIVEKTTQAINKSFETPAAKLAAHNDLNALWMNALEMAPDGTAGVDVANKIKQGIGDAVNWEKRPTPMMHHVELAYREAYGAFREQVHSIVPEVADLNDNLSNLYSARNALTETALQNAAGTGPLSRMGYTQRLEAAGGHVLPGVINATQSILDVPARAGRSLERFSNALGDIRLSDLTQNPFVSNLEAGVLKFGNEDPKFAPIRQMGKDHSGIVTPDGRIYTSPESEAHQELIYNNYINKDPQLRKMDSAAASDVFFNRGGVRFGTDPNTSSMFVQTGTLNEANLHHIQNVLRNAPTAQVEVDVNLPKGGGYHHFTAPSNQVEGIINKLKMSLQGARLKDLK